MEGRMKMSVLKLPANKRARVFGVTVFPLALIACGSGGNTAVSASTTCASFQYQEDAQAEYHPGLDIDGNGVACESLPSRPGPAPAPAPTPTPTPAPTPAPAPQPSPQPAPTPAAPSASIDPLGTLNRSQTDGHQFTGGMSSDADHIYASLYAAGSSRSNEMGSHSGRTTDQRKLSSGSGVWSWFFAQPTAKNGV